MKYKFVVKLAWQILRLRFWRNEPSSSPTCTCVRSVKDSKRWNLLAWSPAIPSTLRYQEHMMIHHRPTKRVRSVLLFNRLFTPEFYLFSCIFDIFFKSILLFLHFAFFYYYYPLCFPILPLLFICVNLLSNFPIFFIFFLFHPWLIFLFMSYLLTLFLLGRGGQDYPLPCSFFT